MSNIVLVNCRNYNGNKNCLFIMQSDDYRLGDGNWSFVANGRFAPKSRSKFLADNGNAYSVFPDWSVKTYGDRT